MKSLSLMLLPALTVFVPVRAQQTPSYTVVDLGPANSPFSQAVALNNYGLAAGVSAASNGSSHAVTWYWGTMTDISQPGLGGANSSAGWVNNFGQIIGQAETLTKDPNNENFCGFGSPNQCVAFLWEAGVMTPLASLGGTNATFGSINNAGEIAGIAETSRVDKSCRPGPSVNGTGPQVLDFEAVVWGPSPGEIRELPPLSGDTVGMALAINDSGQVVGLSGTCANTVLPGFAGAPHAVLWDSDGTAHLLPNLGGSSPNITILAVGNGAFAINNHGVITGQSTLSDNQTFHPVLWQDGIITDLGVLPGDAVGAGLSINNRGDVVGASVTAPGPSTGNPRAFLWRNGQMVDLNTLVPFDAPLYLLTAFSINDSGDVVGFGATNTGELHAFLAMPCHGHSCGSSTASSSGRTFTLSDNARLTLLRLGLNGHR